MFFVEAYFPAAEQVLRISSAFFTLTGYKQSRKYISDKVQVRILVGKEEGWNVKETIIHEIMADLGQCETSLWETVHELVSKMKSGRFIIRDAREMRTPFHTKFYISDDKLIWHGSANYTKRGLSISSEQVSVSHSAEQVKLFSDWFDSISTNAQDLMDSLIKLLEAWLNLATPFEVYLKALLLLNNLPDYAVHSEASPPNYYQKGIIARALRQADEFGGALIVVATGLGKTIIGAELPMRLQENCTNPRIILIAPHGVHDNWQKQLEGRNTHAKFFNINTLFRRTSSVPHHSVNQLDKILRQADNETIIIIDEVHFYRNQLLSEHTKDKRSIVYKRLLPAINRKAKIFLFTATAYGTNFQNLNSLLYLLPHQQPNMIDNCNPWQAYSTDDFARLPVVTVLGLPHVLKMARRRGDVDENGRTYVLFGEERRYLPKSLKLHSIPYQLLLQKELQAAFDNGVFDQYSRFPQSYFDDSTLSVRQAAVDGGYNASLSAWLSSPKEILDVIQRNLTVADKRADTVQLSLESQMSVRTEQPQQAKGSETTQNQHFEVPLHKSLEERQRILQPLASQITLNTEDDDKLHRLTEIVQERCIKNKGKAIIFVGRYFTALYLLEKLKNIFRTSVSIGCTIEQSGMQAKLKANHLRDEERKTFSPQSHNYSPDVEHDILICTDADGVGHNLQDADTVVNYDPPIGADVLFQRAGRVLRMTFNPNRDVHFYTLVPLVINTEGNGSRVQSDITTTFERITRRHDKSKRILGSGVISGKRESEVNLESDLDIEELTRDSEFLLDIAGLGAASMLSHTAVLEQHRQQAENLSGYLMSARSYSQSRHRVFVLLSYKGVCRSVMFDVSSKAIEKRNELDILDLIACTEDELLAPVSALDIERLANLAAQVWCIQEDVSIEEVRKICAVYLVPKNEDFSVRNILHEIKDKEDTE